MGLFGSLTASVSALGSQGEGISVISDNLANVNTIGYKGNRALFSQLVTGSGGGGTSYNAGGVGSAVQRSQDIQGSLLSTSNSTDLALQGDGFFIVTDSQTINTNTNTFYTRAGAFFENDEGFLVNADGLYLNGWETDSNGTILDTQQVVPIEVQSVGASARASAAVTIGANLTSNETLHAFDTDSTVAATLDAVVATPTTADYITDVRLYDSQGNARDVSIGFVKRAQNFWDWTMYTDGANIFGGTTGTNEQIGEGTLRFNEDGTLMYSTGLTVTADWADGSADGSLTLDFGEYTGGRIATADAAGGAEYADGVLDMSITDSSFTAGDYTIYWSAANTLTLYNNNTTSIVGTASISAASSTRAVEFENGGSGLGFFLTVSSEVTDPGGPYSLGGTDLGDLTVSNVAASGGGAGTDGMLQFSASYDTFFAEQDGFGSGTINSITVDEEGFVTGNFTNGETKRLFKVAIGVFPNPSGMESVSGTVLRASDASGAVLIKEAGVGSTGEVISGSLEQSTVDIAGEFSNMIVTQRAYQAASSVITTVDQMLNDLMQLR